MTDWVSVNFGDLASPEPSSFSIGPFGSAITTDNYRENGVPVVRGVNLRNGRFIDDEFVFISEDKADELSRANLKAGDLVFTHRGTIGQVSMIPRLPRFGRYVLSSSQVKARLDHNRAVSEFYYYWFRSSIGQHVLLQNTSTVGVPGIGQPLSTIRSLLVPHPPLAYQRAIADLLGALDDKINANQRAAETSLELGTASYAQASQGSDFSSVALRDAAKWLSGGTPRTSEPAFWGGEIPWISALSLKSPWIDDSDRRLTARGAARARLVEAGAILFVVRGSSLKTEFRIGLAQRQVAFGQDCKALIAMEGIDHDLLFHAIRSKNADILDMVDETSIGAGRLATDLIENLEIRVPLDSNHRIIQLLHALDGFSVSMHRESRMLAELRDVLLSRLMSGELRIKDAERVVGDAI